MYLYQGSEVLMRKRDSSEERISRFDVFIGMRESIDELCKHQGLFGFGLHKFEIEFLKDDDPFGIFSPKYLMCQDVVHGVGVCDYRGGA
jgi:hypothetical protein